MDDLENLQFYFYELITNIPFLSTNLTERICQLTFRTAIRFIAHGIKYGVDRCYSLMGSFNEGIFLYFIHLKDDLYYFPFLNEFSNLF